MTDEELHSLLIGLFEILCPWPARYQIHQETQFKPFKEYHYYLAGRAAGFPLLLLIIAGIIHLTATLL